MHRAELAHLELKNYFAKLDRNNNQTGTHSSSDSTAEDNISGTLLPAIENIASSLPTTANKVSHIGDIISTGDSANNNRRRPA